MLLKYAMAIGLVATVQPEDRPTEGPQPAPNPAEIRPADDRPAALPKHPSADAADGPPPLEGLWPSPTLMESLLARWADEASARYELDEDQRARVQDALVDRWAEFLGENRPLLQPLANEFIEMRLGRSPPDVEAVQRWARRAEPAFERVREEMLSTQDEIRGVLRPMQRARFEVEAIKTRAGLELARQKLIRWSEGEVDPQDIWEPLPSMRKDRRRVGSEAEALAGTTPEAVPTKAETADVPPSDPIAVELDAWEKYVRGFIEAHALDDGQRTAALSCLAELSERAEAHRERYRKEIVDLERRIASPPTSKEELARIQTDLARLYGPIDDMFRELTSRLEAIPSEPQRTRAKAADSSRPSLQGSKPPRKPGEGDLSDDR